jgi:hypothetical protein
LARHVGEAQREQPLHGIHLARVLLQELVSTLGQRRADLDDLAAVRHPQNSIAPLAHALPQVGEEIGEQRQRPGLVLRRLDNVTDEIVALEADPEHARRLAQHAREIVCLERRHVDLLGEVEQCHIGL